MRAIALSDPQHAAVLADELVVALGGQSSRTVTSAPKAPERSSDPIANDRPQMELFGDHDRRGLPPASDCPPDHLAGGDPSSASSSDSDFNDPRRQQRDRPARVTLEPDAPIDATCRAIYEQVTDARKEPLPAAELLWADFADWVVEHRKSWASRAGLKRRWRAWVMRERPLAPETPTTSVLEPARARGPGLASTSVDAELERQELERTPLPQARVAAARLASLFDAGPPRAMSA